MNRSLCSLLTVALLAFTSCKDDKIVGDDGTDPTAVPNPPLNLTAVMAPGGEVILSWRDNSNNEDGFDIHESVGADTQFVGVQTVRSGETSAHLYGRMIDRVYYYKVRSYNLYGYSPFTAVVRVQGGTLFKTFPRQEGTMRDVTFSPDGVGAASGSGNYRIQLWDLMSGTLVRELRGHNGAVSGVQYSTNQTYLVSVSRDRDEVNLWSLVQNRIEKTFVGNRARFSPDGRSLAVGDLKIGGITLYDGVGAGGRPVGAPDLKGWFEFTSDSRFLIVVSADSVRWCDLSDTNLPITRRIRVPGLVVGQSNAFAISPSGDMLASTEGEQVRLWQLGERPVPGAEMRHTQAVEALAFSPDGVTLASAGQDWVIRVWNADTGEQTSVLQGHEYVVYGIAWNRSGSLLGSASGDRTVRIWGPFR
ncbi:MAG: hypothetical protein FJY67_10540 [Calditrichaeota bacterium]|nr:hypothetical protein [Calditrichota bacterium]